MFSEWACRSVIDLHSHILPCIDDGAPDLAASLAMARALVSDGVSVVACTPHILPGLYHNTGPQIRAAVEQLQTELVREGIPLLLVSGADNHIVPDFVAGLRSGHLLTIADTRYVLVEPPHHVAPQRMDELFFAIQAAGYVPILTHPERLSWLSQHYAMVKDLIAKGVWMQITSGSLTGAFGRNALYWATKILGDGGAFIIASDAHDVVKRPPKLTEAYYAAVKLVGEAEAANLVLHRPRGILENVLPSSMPAPPGVIERAGGGHPDGAIARETDDATSKAPDAGSAAAHRSVAERLRSLIK